MRQRRFAKVKVVLTIATVALAASSVSSFVIPHCTRNNEESLVCRSWSIGSFFASPDTADVAETLKDISSFAAVRSAEEASEALADPQVLAVFLDRGEAGNNLHLKWQQHLDSIPNFDATGSLGDAPSWKGIPPQVMPSGALEELGQATMKEAASLARDFLAAASLRQTPIRLRLACIDYVQCSRLHLDDVPLRLVCVLAGAGTEVLPESRADRSALRRLELLPLESQGSMSSMDWNQHIVASGSVEQALVVVPSGWAVLLKGSAWDSGTGSNPGVLHRSPSQASRRVLLQVDFADYVDTMDA